VEENPVSTGRAKPNIEISPTPSPSNLALKKNPQKHFSTEFEVHRCQFCKFIDSQKSFQDCTLVLT
jgi:hypothetical protein